MSEFEQLLNSLQKQIAQKGEPRPETEPDPNQVPPTSGPKLNLPTQKSGFHQLKALRANHYKIISLHVAGLKNKDIATHLGVTQQMVTYTLNSDISQAHISKLLGEYHEMQMGSIKEKLEMLGDLSVLTLEDVLLTAQKDSDRISAARSVLEYIQEKAATTTKHEHSHTITQAEIASMRARMQEAPPPNMIQTESENIEDASFVEIKENENAS